MPSRKTSKAGKKKPAAKKRASTKAKAATRADLEKMLDQLRQIISAAETIITADARRGARSTARTLAVRSTTDTARAAGCLDILVASQIVQDAAGGPHNIDKTLLEVGFISDNERRIFQEDVFNGVLDAGCEINRGDIPSGANNTLREVRTAIRNAAH